MKRERERKSKGTIEPSATTGAIIGVPGSVSNEVSLTM